MKKRMVRGEKTAPGRSTSGDGRRAPQRRTKALLALAVAAVALWRLIWPTSVVVTARREAPGDPVCFWQEDPAWSGDALGRSDRTLGRDGDGTVCLASLLSIQSMESPVAGTLDPGTLNAWLGENGGYDAEGRLDWERVAALLGAKVVSLRPRWNMDGTIEGLLQREIYPVVTVRRPDTHADHQVLVVGSVHGEFVIMDPLDPAGTPDSLALYGNRIRGLRYLDNEEN